MLAGFALLAPATLLAGVLESLGRSGTVLAAIAAAAGAAAFVQLERRRRRTPAPASWSAAPS